MYRKELIPFIAEFLKDKTCADTPFSKEGAMFLPGWDTCPIGWTVDAVKGVSVSMTYRVSMGFGPLRKTLRSPSDKPKSNASCYINQSDTPDQAKSKLIKLISLTESRIIEYRKWKESDEIASRKSAEMRDCRIQEWKRLVADLVASGPIAPQLQYYLSVQPSRIYFPIAHSPQSTVADWLKKFNQFLLENPVPVNSY